MSTDERSQGGSRIYRHGASAPAADDVAHADDERIGAHLGRTIGHSDMVWHEIVSDRVHLDVHVVPATRERPYAVLVTSGMSARPMNVPADVEDRDEWLYAELCMVLPPDWKLDQASFEDDRNYWPVRLLKMLARLPHDYNTWLGWGHSIPNGDPAQPFAKGSSLTGAIVVPPFGLPTEFFQIDGEPTVHVFQVIPVTSAEMDFKLEHGIDELLEKLEDEHPEIYGPLDPKRRSAV